MSDEVERWLTGVRGIAATKIAFSDGTKLKIGDSDGANERTLPTVGAALSPSWHPSGRYIVYCDADDRGTRIAQFDLRTGRTQLLPASSRGLNITPVYTKDGKSIVWASGGDSPAELMLASANGNDSSSVPFVGRSGFETTSPSFSPDGKQIVFMSPRPLTPQLYIMNIDGTGLRCRRRWWVGKRSYSTGPDWSPAGDKSRSSSRRGISRSGSSGQGPRDDPAYKRRENEDPCGRRMDVICHHATTRCYWRSRGIWVLDERTGRLRG